MDSLNDKAADRHLYPVIIACIGQGRKPTITEVIHVAKRIRREAFPKEKISSRRRRAIIMSALAALGSEMAT